MKKIIYAAMFFLAITMMCGNAEKAEAAYIIFFI